MPGPGVCWDEIAGTVSPQPSQVCWFQGSRGHDLQPAQRPTPVLVLRLELPPGRQRDHQLGPVRLGFIQIRRDRHTPGAHPHRAEQIAVMLCRGWDHCQIHLGLLGFCPGDHIIHLAEPGCDMFEYPLPLRLCIGFRDLSGGVLFLSGLQRTAAPSRKNQGIFITGEQLESLLKFPQRLLIPLLIEPGIAQTKATGGPPAAGR